MKITVRDLNQKDISSRNLKKNISGSVIVDISNTSPLSGLLKINDIIIEVQKKQIKKSENLDRILKDVIKNGEQTLLLTTINSNNRRRYLGVKIN